MKNYLLDIYLVDLSWYDVVLLKDCDVCEAYHHFCAYLKDGYKLRLLVQDEGVWKEIERNY